MSRNNTAESSSSAMAIRYLVVLGLLAVLSTASYKIIEKTTGRLETSSAVIGVSVKQSVLSQRIAYLSLKLVEAPNKKAQKETREELKAAISKMEELHIALTKGGTERKLPTTHSKKIHDIYFSTPILLDAYVKDYLKEAKAFASSKPSELNKDNKHVVYITSMNGDLLRGLNSLQHQYVLEAQWYTERLKFFEKAVLVAYILVLILMGLLVFYPMVNRIRQEMFKLKEAEAYTRVIVETAADGVITTNEMGNIESFNRTAEKMFKYKASDIRGKNINSLLATMDGKRSHIEIKHLRSAEMTGIRYENSTFPIYLSVSHTMLGNRQIYICIIHDISESKKAEEALRNAHMTLEQRVKERTSELSKTNALLKQEITERRNIEEALRESERRFRTMADTAPVMIWMAGTDNLNSYFNKIWLEYRGKSLGEEVGKGWLEGIHPEDRKELFEVRSNAFENKNEFKIEYRLQRADGEYRWLLDHGTPRFLEDNSFTGFIGTAIDITERKWAEEEMHRAQKLESLGSLAGGIAHDFNNILTAIMSNTSLAKSGLDETDHTYLRLNEIEKATLRAKDLTHRFLTFAKGGVPIKKTVSIVELLKESASLSLRGSNTKCQFTLDSNLWPVDIDEGQISQVINNLLINANQAMENGGVIHVKAENVKVKGQKIGNTVADNFVKISVEDQGYGIPKENLNNIFDPYFTTKESGTGLGLATTYSIIKKHDGIITVDSEEGKGTTFYIYLPASENEYVEDSEETETQFESKDASQEGRILLMDDEKMIRETAGKVLRYIGYDVEYAEDGSQAIEIYKKNVESGDNFDAVILDLTVPGGMGGEQAIKQLLEIDPEVKAIVSSGYSDNPIMSQFEEYGFSGVIVKPYDLNELKKVLFTVVNS